LKLPKNTKLTAVGSKSAYLDAMTFVTTTDQDDANYNGSVVSETTAAAAYQLAGLGAPDPTTGTISVGVTDANDQGVVGATVTLKTGSGSGPVYTSGSGFDTTATVTVSGGAAFGAVTPGDVTLEVTAPGMTCAPGRYGWASTTGTVDGKAAANTISFFIVSCK
jgi:hypothetical protein